MSTLRIPLSVVLVAALLGTPTSAQSQQTKPQPPPAQLAPKTVPDEVQLFIPYKRYSPEDNQRILKLYAPLRVSDVSDGMDVIGLQDVGIADQAIQPLWRDTQNFTHRIVGIAVTARYVPTNKRLAKTSPEEIDNWYDNITGEPFMDALFPGCVLVIDAEGDGDTRSIGSTNILDWQKLGMVGVITSGGLADSDEIIAHKVPAYYKRKGRGFRPGRNEIESVNRPINLGGVLVRPGDVVMADGDGVIVVPREHAEEVAKAAMQFLDNIGLERYQKMQKQGKP
jgi:4-hydroxy-4-methyl-2-oxoglutarate aldolase